MFIGRKASWDLQSSRVPLGGPEYPQLWRAPPFVCSTNSSREHLQLSEVPTVVEGTSSRSISRVPRVVEGTSNRRTCREQFSGVPRVVEGTSNSHKYLRLPGAVIRSTSSCRGDLHQSEVSPLARSTSSCPKYLQLSRVIFVRQGASYDSLGSLSKLTRRQSTGKSIQIQSDGCQGPTEFTWPYLALSPFQWKFAGWPPISSLLSQVQFATCQFYQSKFDVTGPCNFHKVLKTSVHLKF